MPDDTNAPLTIADLLRIIARRRWVAVVSAGTVLGIALLATVVIRPQYEATAVVAVVKPKQVEGITTGTASEDLSFNLLNSHRELLLSSRVLAQALGRSAIAASPAYRAAGDPVSLLGQRLRVRTSRDTWTIDAALRDEDPVRAEIGLAAVLDAYQEALAGDDAQRTEQRISDLERQIGAANANLTRAVAAEEVFAREHGLVGLDPDANHVAQRFSQLSAARLEAQTELLRRTSVARLIDEARAGQDPATRLGATLRIQVIADDVAVLELRRDLARLEADRAPLLERYGPKHPRVLESDSLLAERQRLLTAAVDQVAGVVINARRELEGRVADLGAQAEAARQELVRYRADLEELKRLSAATTAARRLFETLLARQGEARVGSALKETRAQVVDPPHAAMAPANINPTIVILGGLVLAVIAGALVPLALEAFDLRITSVAEARRLCGLPCLGSLPGVPGGALGLGAVPPAFGDGIAGVRDRLLLTVGARETGFAIVVTGSGHGAGTSTIALHLAAALAAAGKRTLLVDADLRTPVLDARLQVAAPRGFAQLLAGEPEIANTATSRANLDLLASGGAVANPAELLHSHCLPEWLAFARANYDAIVFDAPPASSGPDILSLADGADLLVVVMRNGRTSKDEAAAATELLGTLRSKIAGFVLVGVGSTGKEQA